MAGTDKLKFEEALQQLENIVRALEGEGLTLEDSLAYYQQGIKLVRLCRQCLQEAEGKLQLLLLQEGEVVTREVTRAGDGDDGV